MAKKKIKHLAALRDLGGLPASDGRKVVHGALFRSGHHGKLTLLEAELMKNLFGVSDIVDLRSPSELAEVVDVVADGVDYRHLPPLNDEQNPSINRHNRNDVLKTLMKKEGGTLAHLCSIYRILASSEMALESHRQLLNTALGCKGALLWHCTQGKDRTGIAAAVILMALGVEREVIIEDYLLYNTEARVKNFFIFLGVTVISLGTHKAKQLRNLLTAQRDFIEAFFDEIDKRFGGTEGFLHSALNLDDGTIAELRRKYLV